MRIGLNISTATASRAGIGNYAFQLAKRLPSLAPNDEWIFFGADTSLTAHISARNAHLVPGAGLGLPRILWEQSVLPRLARKEALDLLHGADFSRPLVYGRTTANTIHDLSPFADPGFFPFAKRVYKRALIPLAVRRSQAIITDSEFSKSEILDRFPMLDGRVFPIYLGAPPAKTASRVESAHPFLLFVGTLENRKNLVRLIKAFQTLRAARRFQHKLLLAGGPGHGWDAIKAALDTSGVREAIEVRGYVTEQELLGLYRSATALVYPSLYEGFGLPVLEAMAYGTPVVCSNAASLPEVGGDAVEYFDPRNVEEMAAAIGRVLDSPSLQKEMREKGLKRASQFTWEECARKHIEVYRKVLAQ